jgi:hypothetical protein
MQREIQRDPGGSRRADTFPTAGDEFIKRRCNARPHGSDAVAPLRVDALTAK